MMMPKERKKASSRTGQLATAQRSLDPLHLTLYTVPYFFFF